MNHRPSSLFTTVAALERSEGGGAPVAFDPPPPAERCPKCKRGKLRGSSTRYCHRCGFFITAEVVKAVKDLGL